MKTISITIDESLLERLDDAARTARKTRSELLHQALGEWLDGQRRRRLAAEDRAGYENHPVRPGEFEGLIAAQAAAPPETRSPGTGTTGETAGERSSPPALSKITRFIE